MELNSTEFVKTLYITEDINRSLGLTKRQSDQRALESERESSDPERERGPDDSSTHCESSPISGRPSVQNCVTSCGLGHGSAWNLPRPVCGMGEQDHRHKNWHEQLRLMAYEVTTGVMDDLVRLVVRFYCGSVSLRSFVSDGSSHS
ncbi:hypothetical protein J6590_065487 [Homalodisca vitripennis]|nr:hypothetical protein J6590_065487 [Homalodisca vitripennis]